MGDGAEAALVHRIDPQVASANRPQETHRVLDAEHHHVRLGRRIDREAQPLQAGGEAVRVGVVVGQAIHVVLEGIAARSGPRHRASSCSAPRDLARVRIDRASAWRSYRLESFR